MVRLATFYLLVRALRSHDTVALRVETENSKSNTQQLLIKIVLKNYSPSLFYIITLSYMDNFPLAFYIITLSYMDNSPLAFFIYHHFIIHGKLPLAFLYHDLQKRGKCLPPLLLKTEFLGICYIYIYIVLVRENILNGLNVK